MAVFAENLILCKQKPLYGTHKRAAFAGKVADRLALKRCLKQISRAYTDAKRYSALHGAAGSILINGIRRIQSPSFKEHCAQRCSGTLRGNHNNVDTCLRNNTRTVIPGNCKPMREIQCLAGSKIFLYPGPYRHNGGIRKQAHHYRTALCRFLNRKQSLARHPAVGNSLVVCLSLALANYHIKTVIAQVKALPRPLHAVSKHSYSLVLKHFACLFQWKFIAGDYSFLNSAKIQFCHKFIKIK